MSANDSPAALAREIRAWLAKTADPDVRVWLETLIPGARAVGVKVPALRVYSAQLRAAHKSLPLETVADLMDTFAKAKVREEILIGAFWLARYGKKIEALPWRRIAAWLPALDNWETCDQLAMGVAARVVAADLANVPALVRLTASPSEWTRRFALATASALNQKGRSHVQETLAVCDPLIADPSPNVRKAVGWALREACKHDPAAVEAFLKSRAARAHRSVVREGSEKLPAARREALIRLVAPTAGSKATPKALKAPGRVPRPS
ncbi:MAG TPA: DNA alkylation repair protein [Candidatus Eisenbacteria bacterium]|nr:DNA alkylation repair protein [Candidatus Eisenbacteria bacterium]